MKMKRTGAIIISAAVAASIFAGCSQPTEETSVSVSETPAMTTAPSEVTTTETEYEIPESMEEVYGNQISNYLGHQYYFNGEPIPTWETNYYFMETFNVLNQYAASSDLPITTYGCVDLAAEYPGDEFATYGDYLIRQAEETIQSKCILCMRAEADGVVLDDETYATIDELIEQYRTYVSQLGLSLDDYLHISLGPDIDETTFRKISEIDYLSNKYADYYCANYDEKIPQIRYVFFPATEADDQAVKDAASNAATQLKDACENDLEKIPVLAEEAKTAGTDLDYGDLNITLEKFPLNLEEWAWSENRAAGDIDIVIEPELGYFVVGYLGTTPDVEKATESLIAEINDDIETNPYDFHTDGVFLPAPAAPTATPTPEVQTEPSTQVSFDPNAVNPSAPSVTVPEHKVDSNEVIAVVLYTLAGVAIAAVVGLLIAAAVKKSKNAPDTSEAFDDDYEEDDESETDADVSEEDEEEKTE